MSGVDAFKEYFQGIHNDQFGSILLLTLVECVAYVDLLFPLVRGIDKSMMSCVLRSRFMYLRSQIMVDKISLDNLGQ